MKKPTKAPVKVAAKKPAPKAPPKAPPKKAAGPRMTPGPIDPGMGGSGGMGMAPGALPQIPGMM